MRQGMGGGGDGDSSGALYYSEKGAWHAGMAWRWRWHGEKMNRQACNLPGVGDRIWCWWKTPPPPPLSPPPPQMRK